MRDNGWVSRKHHQNQKISFFVGFWYPKKERSIYVKTGLSLVWWNWSYKPTYNYRRNCWRNGGLWQPNTSTTRNFPRILHRGGDLLCSIQGISKVSNPNPKPWNGWPSRSDSMLYRAREGRRLADGTICHKARKGSNQSCSWWGSLKILWHLFWNHCERNVFVV